MQVTFDIREDWLPIIRESVKVLQEVLAAGEAQRLSKGQDPNAWMTSDPMKRLNHVINHILKCHHEGKLNVLTNDTYLEEWKHALCGLAIIAALEAKKEQAKGIIVEIED